MDTSNQSCGGAPQPLLEQLQERNGALRPAALAELLGSDQEVGPLLAAVSDCLEDESSQTRELAVLVLEKAGVQALAPLGLATAAQQPLQVRIAAAAALGRMGNAAAPAIAQLTRCVLSADELLRTTAAMALGSIGAPAVPALGALLQSGDEKITTAALDALGRIGGQAQAVLADLQALCASDSPGLRMAGCAALIKISGDPAEALPNLLEGLEHPDEIVRKASMEHIGGLQDVAKGVIEVLLPYLQDPAAAVRAACALALVRIDPTCTQAIDPLIALLQDAETEPRLNAGIALATMGPAAASAVATLKIIQSDPDPRMAGMATAALQHIAPQEVRHPEQT